MFSFARLFAKIRGKSGEEAGSKLDASLPELANVLLHKTANIAIRRSFMVSKSIALLLFLAESRGSRAFTAASELTWHVRNDSEDQNVIGLRS